jgi:hypothetical protein
MQGSRERRERRDRREREREREREKERERERERDGTFYLRIFSSFSPASPNDVRHDICFVVNIYFLD